MRISYEEALKRGWITPTSTGYALCGPCHDRRTLEVATHASCDAASVVLASDNKVPNSSAKTETAQPPAALRKRKKDAEGNEQTQLIKWFRTQYPDAGHLLIHIPNGGSRKNSFEGWRLKEQGVRAGVSDLFLPVARGNYHGLWIEFKAAPPNTAAVSASQLEWVHLMVEQGYAAHICMGVDQAMAVLSRYLSTGT